MIKEKDNCPDITRRIIEVMERKADEGIIFLAIEDFSDLLPSYKKTEVKNAIWEMIENKTLFLCNRESITRVGLKKLFQ